MDPLSVITGIVGSLAVTAIMIVALYLGVVSRGMRGGKRRRRWL